MGTTTPATGTTLHIDGAKDNTSATPTATEVANDVVVTDTGNVGIGTATPATNLDVVSSSGTIRSTRVSSASVFGPTLGLVSNRGTVDSPAALTDNNYLGKITFDGYHGTGYTNNGAMIAALASGDFTPADHKTTLQFFVKREGGFQVRPLVLSSNGASIFVSGREAYARLDVQGYIKLANTDPITDDAAMTEVNKVGVLRYNSGLQYHDGTTWNTVGTTAGASASKWTNDATNTRVALTNLSDGTTARTAGTEFVVNDIGSIGIGTATTPFSISLGGEVSKNIAVLRRTTDNAGSALILTSGGAYLGGTDRNGGTLLLSSGTSTGTGTSNILFRTATPGTTGTTDNAPTTKMVIMGTGNVGIGTTAPVNLTEISNANGMPTGETIRDLFRVNNNLQNGTAGNTLQGGIVFSNVNSLDIAAIRVKSNRSISHASNLTFWTKFNNADPMEERMLIDNTGRVGIGTSTPTSKLQVVGLPVHADNAAAITAGLTAGAFYHAGDGVLRVVF